MKTSNKILLAVLILILIAITIGLGALKSFLVASDKDSISGNKVIKSEIRSVPDFSGVSVCCKIQVNLKQGNVGNVQVRADENILPEIKTKVVDGVLKIYTERKIRKAEVMQVDITTESIQYLELSSASSIDTPEEIKGNNLTIKSSSAAKANLIVEYNTINCDQSSGGELKVRGTTDVASFDNSSGGQIHAKGLAIKSCRVNSSSGARTEINVLNELDADASSGARIIYEGDPEVKNIQSSSGGSIKKTPRSSAVRKKDYDKTPALSFLNLFSNVYKATL